MRIKFSPLLGEDTQEVRLTGFKFSRPFVSHSLSKLDTASLLARPATTAYWRGVELLLKYEAIGMELPPLLLLFGPKKTKANVMADKEDRRKE